MHMVDLDFGRNLRRLREDRGISLADFAKRLNLSRSDIARIEHGMSVSRLRLLELADELGLSNSERIDFFNAIFHSIEGHAFISYVREDTPEVDRLEADLKSAGIPVWRDVRDLWPGKYWKREIRLAIENGSCAFIACFSHNSRARAVTHQREELILAVECLRRRAPERTWMYPVRLDDGPISDYDLGAGRTLSDLQRTDLFGPNRDVNFDRLVESIKRSDQDS